MPDHSTPLIGTIAVGLVLAYAFGLLAQRLRLQPLVGYLVAGIVVGPYTPGFVADQKLAVELAEIGVILLMFGVGLHISIKDLASVARIAVPGAIGQIAATTAMGAGIALSLGWDVQSGLLFGFALSVASTVVLVRTLQEHHIIDTQRGRIAVGWVIVEDLVMIVALVLLPAIAAATVDGGGSIADTAAALALTIGKIAAFVALMLLVGRRVIPWLMHHTAHTGSRELFRLAVYASAIGIAYGAYEFFDASFALGAFFAGMVLGETSLSQRATEEALPLRDAFAVLFFVSVGMLVDPAIVVEEPIALFATVLVIVVGKPVAGYLIVVAFGHPSPTALTVSVSRAQIGEFSFILAGLGVTLGMIDGRIQELILAGAIVSIILNPLVFALADRPLAPAEARAAPAHREDGPRPRPARHVIVGYGRVGSVVGHELLARGEGVVVIENQPDAIERALSDGAEVVNGNAAHPEILALANLGAAARLFVTIPEPFEAGQIIEQAKTINPALKIFARAHSDDGVRHLDGIGSHLTVMGEREIARRMLDAAR